MGCNRTDMEGGGAVVATEGHLRSATSLLWLGAVTGKTGGRGVLRLCDSSCKTDLCVSCRQGGIRLNFRNRDLGAGWIEEGGGEAKRPIFNLHRNSY